MFLGSQSKGPLRGITETRERNGWMEFKKKEKNMFLFLGSFFLYIQQFPLRFSACAGAQRAVAYLVPSFASN